MIDFSAYLKFGVFLATITTNLVRGDNSPLNATTLIVRPGSVAKLHCDARRSSQQRYWWKDGERIVLNKKRKINRKGILMIKKFEKKDEGFYVCKLKNGQVVKRITLLYEKVVRAKPYLQPDFPRNALAHVGEDASMECYELFSSKMGTMVDFRWFLWLIEPSTKMEQELHKLVFHKNFTHNVKLISSSYYESKMKTTTNNKRLYGVRMNLFNVSKKDAGYYSCVACNHLGCAITTANLTVVDDIDNSPLNATTLIVRPGSVAKLHCDARRISQQRYWWKDGERIVLNKKRKINRKGILMIKKFEKKDEGFYVCKLKNGQVVKRITLLYEKISGRPVFRYGENHVLKGTKVALVGGNVKFECKAEGTQPISYVWQKDKMPLKRRNYVANGFSLSIDNLVLIDNGNYTCTASNAIGKSLCSHSLYVVEVVRAKPYLQPDFPRNALAHVGEDASMECYELFSSKMGTMVDFRWFLWLIEPSTKMEQELHKLVFHKNFTHNVKLISSSYYESKMKTTTNNKRLYGVRMNLFNVSKKDAGYYSCVACNHLGCAITTANLTVVDDIDFMTVTSPAVGQRQKPKKQNEMIYIIVFAVLAIVVIIMVLLFVQYRKLLRNCERKRTGSSGDTTTDANLNKKDYIDKYGDGGKFQMPLILKSSGRTASESHWSISFQQRSLQSPTPLIDDVCLETLEIPFDRQWEIEKESLILGETLGEGAFGVVVKAEALCLPSKSGAVTTVAVKMLKADATEHELHDLLSEMETMKQIGQHKNIINFLGCCTRNGTVYAVVEYAPYGNLRQYLRSSRPSMDSDERVECAVTLPTLVSFAFQVAKGMEFLADHQCIHRDLAARNVLVGKDYVMKIADFGLARNVREADYYRKTTDGRLPIKWLSIEALFDRVYTTQSDVWAFGVLLWEIFTLGGSPYPSVPVGKLFSLLKSGYRMQKPQGCPSEMYEIMLKCWYENAIARPSFSMLVRQFESLLESFTAMDYIEVVADSTNCIVEEEEAHESDTAEPVSEDSAGEETPFDMLEESAV